LTGRPAHPPLPFVRRLAGLGWWILLALLVAMPGITGGERIEFRALGYELNLRFVVYAISAFVLALCAAPIVAIDALEEPRRVLVAAVFFAWLLLSVLFAGSELREWLPPVVRWVLYLSVFVIARHAGSAEEHQTRMRMARAAIVVGLLVPLAVGGAQLLSGTAPVLNGAPRISATTFGHPVAFSLLLMVGGLVLVPIAARAPGVRTAVAIGALALFAIVTAELVFTYTRLTLVLLLIGMVATVISLNPASRLRAASASSAAALLVLVVATPLLVSRFEEPTVWPSPKPTATSSQDGQATPEATPDLEPTPVPRLVLIDNSAKLRLDTHLRGLTYIAQSPVVGHGPGSFDRLYERDTGKPNVAAHDDMLLFAVETGIPGLILLLVLYGAVTLPLLPALADGRPNVGFEVSALLAFILLNVGAAIHNPTYFPEVEVAAWTLVGLAGAGAPPLSSWLRLAPARQSPARKVDA